MMDYAVQINNLSFAYDGNKEALKDINLEIDKGSFVAIVGPNGSGKTTLARVISGLIKNYKGSVSINGEVGFLPQITRINPYFPLSVEDVVKMGLYKDSSSSIFVPLKNTNRVKEALKSVNMFEFASSPFAHLSGGQRQRVLIARVLAEDPDILLLDEPQTGLDVQSRMELINIINKIREEKNLTIIMITHFLNELLPYIDEVVYLKKKIYLKGNPEKVLSENILSEIYGVPVKIADVDGHKCVIIEDSHHD